MVHAFLVCSYSCLYYLVIRTRNQATVKNDLGAYRMVPTRNPNSLSMATSCRILIIELGHMFISFALYHDICEYYIIFSCINFIHACIAQSHFKHSLLRQSLLGNHQGFNRVSYMLIISQSPL